MDPIGAAFSTDDTAAREQILDVCSAYRRRLDRKWIYPAHFLGSGQFPSLPSEPFQQPLLAVASPRTPAELAMADLVGLPPHPGAYDTARMDEDTFTRVLAWHLGRIDQNGRELGSAPLGGWAPRHLVWKPTTSTPLFHARDHTVGWQRTQTGLTGTTWTTGSGPKPSTRLVVVGGDADGSPCRASGD